MTGFIIECTTELDQKYNNVWWFVKYKKIRKSLTENNMKIFILKNIFHCESS